MLWNDSTAAIRDVESELAAVKAEHDHSHRISLFRTAMMIARLSFNTTCELGFRGGLDE
jgi:hypothetical protein